MLLPFALICVLCLSLDDFNYKNAAAIPQKYLGIFVQLLIIREFDEEAADGMKEFWFGKKEESGESKQKEASDISKIREKS